MAEMAAPESPAELITYLVKVEGEASASPFWLILYPRI